MPRANDEGRESQEDFLTQWEPEVIQLLQVARTRWMARYPWPEWWNHVHSELSFVDISLSTRTKRPELKPFVIRALVESGILSWTRGQITMCDQGTLVWTDEDILTVVPMKFEFWRIAVGDAPARPLINPSIPRIFSPLSMTVEEWKEMTQDLKFAHMLGQPSLGSVSEWIRGAFLSLSESILSTAEWSLGYSERFQLWDQDQFVRRLLAEESISSLIEKALRIASGQSELISTDQLFDITIYREEVSRKIIQMEKEFLDNLSEEERLKYTSPPPKRES